MNKKGQITFSLATMIIVVLSIVAIGSGIVLVNKLTKAVELPALGKIPQFFQLASYPDKGQTGTIFRINLELTNKTGMYLIDAKITKLGSPVKTIPLYDDGSHGDAMTGDGIYANIWNSEKEQEGVYGVDIIINPSENQMVYTNVSTIKIFKPECEPLVYNGNPSDKVDVAILAYGYTDMNQFKNDALKWINTGLFAYEPFKSNSGKFNFYLINQQQSDFSCTRDESTRTLIYCDDDKVEKQASQCPADQIVILLNDKEFCGTASTYARACNGYNLKQVLTHEFGHTFGGLGDEYSYSAAYPEYKAIAANYPNCDVEGCSKWASFNQGCFAGCGVDELFRPTDNNCLMKRYTNVFCPICARHIEELLNNYVIGSPAVQTAPPSEKTYLIDFNYNSGKLAYKNAYVTNSSAPDRKAMNKFDYTGKIISFDGKEISSFNFELPNVLHMPPPMNENESAPPDKILDKISWTVPASQSDRASRLEVYDKNQNKLLAIDIGYLSNSCGNLKCESHESNVECPADCRADVKDDLCNYAKDKVCDPDCPEVDTDCRKADWLLISIIAISLILVVVIVVLMQIKPSKDEL
jgi:hypothetical protein